MKLRARPLLLFTATVALLSTPLPLAHAAPFSPRTFDRSRLPASLRHVPLDHLSSGALLRLDQDGDLVENPTARAARLSSAATRARPAADAPLVALDPRVAANIRLGDDPPALPSNMRAQAEPHIARSPVNADVLLATFQEGRFTNGGAVDCGYSVSRDGGLTWNRALIPNLTAASGGPYFRATDPVAGIGADGALYLNTIGSTDAQFNTAAVLVSRSTDGGLTFAPPSVVFQSPSSLVFPDKNWMAINTFPGTPAFGRIFVAFAYFTGNPNGAPIASSYSDNNGATWSPIAFIHSQNSDTQGAQPIYLANGKLAVVYWNFNGTGDFADDFMQVVISDNGGNTFGPPKFITNVPIHNEPSIRNGVFLPSVATDRTTGAIYVVYQARVAGAPASSSLNPPTTATPGPLPSPSAITPPAPASSTPPSPPPITARSSPPPSTTIAITPAPPSSSILYLAQSLDGGATWQPNIRLSLHLHRCLPRPTHRLRLHARRLHGHRPRRQRQRPRRPRLGRYPHRRPRSLHHPHRHRHAIRLHQLASLPPLPRPDQ